MNAETGRQLYDALQKLPNLSPRSAAVRAWVVFELLRGGSLPPDEASAKAVTPPTALGAQLAWGAVARRLAATGNAPPTFDAWPEPVRPLALAGAALGIIDAAK